MADKYIVTHDDMVSVADEIRAKNGTSDSLTFPLGWKEAIQSIKSEEQLKASEYPSYIHQEVLTLANKVASVKKDDSIVFVAMSDSHYVADQALNFYDSETNASTIQANQAAKVLAYLLDIDFFAHLGDVSCGANSTTPNMIKKQIEGFLSYFREAKSDLPVFLCIGNHDAGIYYHNTQTDGAIHTMTGEYLYKNFTAHSESNNTVVSGEEYGGYCYRDFADKKLRVIMLNTSEKLVGAQIDNTTYGTQRVWLANAILNLNNKSDAADWGFIILSHYPADYGATMPLSTILEAYVNGSSITITDPVNDYHKGDGTDQTISFAGKNVAKFVAQFHGHIHNFLHSKMYSNASGNAVQYDAWRVCIPNGQFNRENTYATVNNISFKEDETYAKTANSADGTSFVVNVINPGEEKIYSFCYGAGYDRIIGYAKTNYYSITYNLTGVEMDSNGLVYSVEDGKSLVVSVNSASIADGYSITTAKVTMGGVDITSSVYNNGQVSIAEVTGNVIITITATKAPTTNLGLIAEERHSTNIYNGGLGYKNNYRITDSTDVDYEIALNGYVITGWIPYTVTDGVLPKTIIIKGAALDTSSYCRIRFFRDKTETSVSPYISGSPNSNEVTFEDVFTVQTLGDKHYKLTPIPSSTGGMIGTYTNINYFRISLIGTGEDLIITFEDTVIEDVGPTSYTITNNLTHVTNSNSATSVDNGALYSATLTAVEGYTIAGVTVTMGGTDITSTAYSNGTISITNVTGNIVVTAIANAVQTSYTNQLSISTDTDGSVYNGIGYKADSYLTSGTVGTRTGVYTSGFIPCKAGDTLYFKNVTLQDNQGNHRFSYYDSSKTFITNGHFSTSNDSTAHIIITYGSDGNIVSLTIPSTSTYAQKMGYIRFCCGGLGATSIVTVNDPIE